MSRIVTHKGNYVDLLNPDPNTIDIEDIAHHLSFINRFTGATDRAYSVGAHSLFVSYIVPEEFALDGLLHDATEAYLGDISSPLKSLLPEYKKLEQRMHEVISNKYGTCLVIPNEVHLADEQAYVKERTLLLTSRPISEDRDYKRFANIYVPYKKLFRLLPDGVYRLFLERFEELSNAKSNTKAERASGSETVRCSPFI